MSQNQSVLFVCLGNICRSPLAEGIFRDLVAKRGLSDQFTIDSCGTSSHHVGELPHRGSRKIAAQRGVALDGQTSRQLCDQDYVDFGWLVAMDSSNRSTMRHVAPSDFDQDRIVLLLDYARGDAPRDVPDPYYVGGFDVVFDMILDGCEGFLDHICAQR